MLAGSFFFVLDLDLVLDLTVAGLVTSLAITTQSIILTKIVHRTRDCVRIIAGVQHIDGSLEVKYWGFGPL